MACQSCKIFTPIEDVAHSYGQQLFNALALNASHLFTAFLGVWLVWMLINRGYFKGNLNLLDFSKSLLTFTTIAALLKGHSLYWEWVYQPLYQSTTLIAQKILTLGVFEGGNPTIPGMLQTMEDELAKIFQVYGLLMKDSGWFSPRIWVGALMLILPFIFVWGIFLGYVLEGICKLTMITAVSPLLIVCAGFSSTRGFTLMGGRIILGGSLGVIFAAVAMGFTLKAFHEVTHDVQITSDFVFSPDYWTLFLLGFVSILFHLKAATVASNLSGAADSPTAVSAVVGAGMAAAGYAKGKVFGMGSRGLSAMGEKASKNLKERH